MVLTQVAEIFAHAASAFRTLADLTAQLGEFEGETKEAREREGGRKGLRERERERERKREREREKERERENIYIYI